MFTTFFGSSNDMIFLFSFIFEKIHLNVIFVVIDEKCFNLCLLLITDILYINISTYV